MTGKSSGFAHRKDVDGLRAVAIASVVAYHAFPSLIPGGFVGVDIFFVISGFIITSLILSELDRGRFSFAGFYSRRVRRIFPPLIVVMVSCLAFGWFVLFGGEYAQLARHVVAGASFVPNIALWTEAGYFDNAGETKPLLHLWSLGIEEQFYFVWPLLVWAGWKFRFNVATVAGLIAAASLILCIVSIGRDAVATFYSPLTRFWELLAGGLLAWSVTKRGSPVLGSAAATVLSLSGAILLVISFAVIRPEGFPGAWALLPVVGATLVIGAGPSAKLNLLLLSNPVALWLGWISFSLYLWHWPLLSFPRILLGDHFPNWLNVVLVLIAVGLAWISTRFLETPIRRTSGRRVVAPLVVSMLLVGCTALWIWQSGGVADRGAAKVGEVATRAQHDWAYDATTMVDGRIAGLHILAGVQDKSVLFVGSSLMGQYYPRAARIFSEATKPRLSAIYASRNNCTPIPDYDLISGPENINCIDYYRAAMALAEDGGVAKVVLGGDWPRFFSAGKLTEQGEKFAEELRHLKTLGKEVFLIGRPPFDKRFEPMKLARSGNGRIPDWSISRAEAEDEESIADTGKLAALVGAVLINPLDSLCNDTCPVVKDGRPLYTDAAHITASYAAGAATFIDKLVER